MPLDRRFPSEHRFKVEFSDHPPLYVFHDNHGGWNVDTRFLTPKLRNWIEDTFNSVFDDRFPELFVDSITNRDEDEILSIFILHVTLEPDVSNPRVVLRYYDDIREYPIPGRITTGYTLHRDQILDEITK
jgi:hypothetical protein